jgi:hypothetical protein
VRTMSSVPPAPRLDTALNMPVVQKQVIPVVVLQKSSAGHAGRCAGEREDAPTRTIWVMGVLYQDGTLSYTDSKIMAAATVPGRGAGCREQRRKGTGGVSRKGD